MTSLWSSVRKECWHFVLKLLNIYNFLFVFRFNEGLVLGHSDLPSLKQSSQHFPRLLIGHVLNVSQFLPVDQSVTAEEKHTRMEVSITITLQYKKFAGLISDTSVTGICSISTNSFSPLLGFCSFGLFPMKPFQFYLRHPLRTKGLG